MVRLVEAAAIEVVAEACDGNEAEGQLLRFGKRAAQAGIIGDRLFGDGAHDRHQLGAQLRE